MKKKYITLGVVVLVILLIPAIVLLTVAVGMGNNTKPRDIKADWVNEYKSTMDENFSAIDDVHIYYQTGRVNFNFTLNSEMSLDDCKKIIKTTKEFAERDTAPIRSPKTELKEHGLSLNFAMGGDTYIFECSNWIPIKQSDGTSSYVENNHKIWSFRINDVHQDDLEF